MSCFPSTNHFLLIVMAILIQSAILVTACPSTCYCKSRMFECSSAGLEQIPKDIPTESTYVSLKNNNIATISASSLSHLSSLSNVILKGNQITVVPSGSFVNKSKLTHIDLSNNIITEVQPGAFKNVPQILSLQLNNNQLDDVDAIFDDMHTLQTLDLKFNRLASISEKTFYGLTEITSLSLSGNQISYISNSTFANMTKLKKLFLNGNPIKNFAGIWKSLPGLRFLDLSSCQLDRFPADLPITLNILKLSNNSLRAIGISDLERMNVLNFVYLDYNRIENIEKGAIAHTPNLTYINVNGNRLRILPTPIPANVGLFHANDNNIERVYSFNFDHDSLMTELFLNNNSIEALTARTFARLGQLSKLYLEHNNIKVMHQMAFSRLRQLYELRLDSNPIKVMDNRAFGGLSQLSSLSLSYIKGNVSGVTGEVFRDVWFVKTLNLEASPNLMMSILYDTQVLSSLRLLEVLNLRKNNLTHLDTTFQTWLPKLRSIKLTQNPWFCDDTLIPLRKLLDSAPRMFSPINKIVCQQPNQLKGVPIVNVALDQFKPIPTTTTTTAPITTTMTKPTATNTVITSTTTFTTAGSSITTPIPPTKPPVTASTKTNEPSSSSSSQHIVTSAKNEPSTTATTGRLTRRTPQTNYTNGPYSSSSRHIITPFPSLSSTIVTKTKATRSSTLKMSATTSLLVTKKKKITRSDSISTITKNEPNTTARTTTMATRTSQTKPKTQRSTSKTTSLTTATMVTKITPELSRNTRFPSGSTLASSTVSANVTFKQEVSSIDKTTPPNRVDQTFSSSYSIVSSKTISGDRPTTSTTRDKESTTDANDTNKNRNTKKGTIDTTASGRQDGAQVKRGESRLTNLKGFAKPDNTKIIAIAISTTVVALLIIILVIAMVLYRRKRKRIQDDQSNFRYTNQQDFSSSSSLSDTSLIFTRSNSLTAERDIHEVSPKIYGENDRPRGDGLLKSIKLNINCFKPHSNDDSEMLMRSWEEPRQ